LADIGGNEEEVFDAFSGTEALANGLVGAVADMGGNEIFEPTLINLGFCEPDLEKVKIQVVNLFCCCTGILQLLWCDNVRIVVEFYSNSLMR
jgi:hypothetical protein